MVRTRVLSWAGGGADGQCRSVERSIRGTGCLCWERESLWFERGYFRGQGAEPTASAGASRGVSGGLAASAGRERVYGSNAGTFVGRGRSRRPVPERREE